MFDIGEVIVYPAHGLTEVQAVEDRKLDKHIVKFYVLKILRKNISVMVPMTNLKKIGLRRVCEISDILEIEDVLKTKSDCQYTQWHHRFNENSEKLKSGKFLQIVEILRDLT